MRRDRWEPLIARCSPERPRRRIAPAAEHARHMFLVGEAAGERDLGDGIVGRAQQTLRVLDAQH